MADISPSDSGVVPDETMVQNKAQQTDRSKEQSTASYGQSNRTKLSTSSLVALSPKHQALRQKQRGACLAFIEVILFMVGFLVLMWTHEDIERVFELEHVMKLTLTKPYGEHSLTFADINDVTEIWKWVDIGLLPAVVRHTDAVSIYVANFDVLFSTYSWHTNQSSFHY